MPAVELLQRVLHTGLAAAEQAQEVGDALAVVGLVTLGGDVDVVGLDIEDELVLGPFLLEGLRVLGLLGADLVEGAEDFVEGEERRGGAAGTVEEPAAIQAETARVAVGDFLEALLDRL